MKLQIGLVIAGICLSGCFDPGGTALDDVFHPKGTCGVEIKVNNQSSKAVPIDVSAWDDGEAYCDRSGPVRASGAVDPGKMGSARAELQCHRCWLIRTTVSAGDGYFSNGDLVTCADDGGCKK